jgi:hypothetical protein
VLMPLMQGIVTSSFEREGGGFLVTPLDPHKHFPGQKYIKQCTELLPLGDAAVSPLEIPCVSKEQSKGKDRLLLR